MFVFVVILLMAQSVFASSGDCSSHDGVDCSSQSSTGHAVCNDGFISSDYYTSESECKLNISQVCPTPFLFGATNSSICDQYQAVCDQTNSQRATFCARNGLSGSNCTPIPCTQVDSCKQEVANNTAAITAWNQCIQIVVNMQKDQVNTHIVQTPTPTPLDPDLSCQKSFGLNAQSVPSQPGYCRCTSGYIFNDDKTECVPTPNTPSPTYQTPIPTLKPTPKPSKITSTLKTPSPKPTVIPTIPVTSKSTPVESPTPKTPTPWYKRILKLFHL